MAKDDSNERASAERGARLGERELKSSERASAERGARLGERESKMMRVGELAKAVGKTVRAMHLYEELGLLEPRTRSDGGFRMYGPEAIDRIHWIVKLQAIGFTLAEIQGFVGEFQGAGSGREATARVRALFTEKQSQIREQIVQLQV